MPPWPCGSPWRGVACAPAVCFLSELQLLEVSPEKKRRMAESWGFSHIRSLPPHRPLGSREVRLGSNGLSEFTWLVGRLVLKPGLSHCTRREHRGRPRDRHKHGPSQVHPNQRNQVLFAGATLQHLCIPLSSFPVRATPGGCNLALLPSTSRCPLSRFVGPGGMCRWCRRS